MLRRLRPPAPAHAALVATPGAGAVPVVRRRVAAPGRLAGVGAGLLLAAGVLSTLVSYDPGLSARFLLLLALGLAVGGAVAGGVLRPAWVVAAGAVLGGALALYFLFQNDFTGRSKFDLVHLLGGLTAGRVPDLGWHKPHPNVVAGGLEAALPCCLALAGGSRGLGRGAGVALAALCAYALFLTESRGAWAALAGAAALTGLAYLCRAARQGRIAPRLAWRAGAGIGAGLAVVGGAILVVTLHQPALLGSVLARLTLYRQAVGLVLDYPFTGAGLGTFAPTFSRYILLEGSPPEPHAHNLWLNLWIGLGLAGVLGYAAITVGTAWAALRTWRAPTAPGALFWAALTAWLALLLHDLFDDVHSPALTLPLLLVLPALVGNFRFWTLRSAQGQALDFGLDKGKQRQTPASVSASTPNTIQNPKPKIQNPKWPVLGLALVLGLVAAWMPLLSLAQSNIGNLYQARQDFGGATPDRAVAADAWLSAAWATWPGNPSAARRAPFLYLSVHQMARALAYQQATSAGVDLWPAIARYFMYYRQEPDYALTIDRQAVALGTTNPLAYYALAQDSATHAAWPAAVAQQQRALALDPRPTAEAYILLGDWRLRTGDSPAALAAYRQALQLAPGQPTAAANIARLEAGR